MGIEGSCQGQERGREGTRTEGEQAGPRISSLCSLQGPKVFGKKVGSRKSQGLSKSSLQPSPAASTLCTLPSPPGGSGEDRCPTPTPPPFEKLFSPSRLRASSKGTGTCPLTSRHSGSFPPRGGGRRTTRSLERHRPGHCHTDSTGTRLSSLSERTATLPPGESLLPGAWGQDQCHL